MKTIEVDGVRHAARTARVRPGESLRTALLVCGILAALLYVGMNIIVPLRWEGYSFASRVVSELSAIDAPTRPLWLVLGAVFTVLFVAFGVGVVASAGQSRALRRAGVLIIAHGLLGAWWPPMHLRGTEPTLTDTLHIVWTAAAVLLMMLTIGFAAAAFGRRFRLYSTLTVVVMVAFGVLTSLDGPRIAANLPTPWVGVWERISIAAFFQWLVVLAVVLLRRREPRSVPRSAGSLTPNRHPGQLAGRPRSRRAAQRPL